MRRGFVLTIVEESFSDLHVAGNRTRTTKTKTKVKTAPSCNAKVVFQLRVGGHVRVYKPCNRRVWSGQSSARLIPTGEMRYPVSALRLWDEVESGTPPRYSFSPRTSLFFSPRMVGLPGVGVVSMEPGGTRNGIEVALARIPGRGSAFGSKRR